MRSRVVVASAVAAALGILAGSLGSAAYWRDATATSTGAIFGAARHLFQSGDGGYVDLGDTRTISVSEATVDALRTDGQAAQSYRIAAWRRGSVQNYGDVTVALPGGWADSGVHARLTEVASSTNCQPADLDATSTPAWDWASDEGYVHLTTAEERWLCLQLSADSFEYENTATASGESADGLTVTTEPASWQTTPEPHFDLAEDITLTYSAHWRRSP